eukprot:7020562-Prorocentrum_lima.AAC.1
MWIYTYNRYLYLQHLITATQTQTLEQHLRQHANTPNARAYILHPLTQGHQVEAITTLLGGAVSYTHLRAHETRRHL